MASRQTLSVPGMKVTKQRALIVDIMRQRRGHLDADEIYRQAREKAPRLSLSTVYRTLQKLKDLDLVEELHFSEEHHHYETKPTTEHHHLLCLGCGRVIEFSQPLSHDIKKNVPEARDFEITGTEVRMMGFCPKCRRR